MRKFKPGEYVTPKVATPVYYYRYYYNGTYGEFFRGRIIRFEPGMVGVVRSVAPTVWQHEAHEEFLVIDFCEPITGKVQRVGLHRSEVRPVEKPSYEIQQTGEAIPAEAFSFVR